MPANKKSAIPVTYKKIFLWNRAVSYDQKKDKRANMKNTINVDFVLSNLTLKWSFLAKKDKTKKPIANTELTSRNLYSSIELKK